MTIDTIQTMAEVLSETVPEISDAAAARRALGFAGFFDLEISLHLRCAQRLARQLRGQEADRLYARQFNPPPRKLRHG